MVSNQLPERVPVIQLTRFRTFEAFCLKCVGTIDEEIYLDADGKSVEDIAVEQNHPWVVSIQLVKIGEGIGTFNEKDFRVRTKTLETLGRKYFIDATTFTKDELEAMPLDKNLTQEQKTKIISYMENNKKERLVRTKANSWEDINEDDRILNTLTQEITSP